MSSDMARSHLKRASYLKYHASYSIDDDGDDDDDDDDDDGDDDDGDDGDADADADAGNDDEEFAQRAFRNKLIIVAETKFMKPLNKQRVVRLPRSFHTRGAPDQHGAR